ncbi:MAG: carbamoyltransferase HypF [Maribacter sp.]|nr:carbamoyltransferase HypF [Maribacter sp.]
MPKTYKILISGTVQGVGFRPFVYLLAHQFEIKGTVSNNREGVIIYASGTQNNIQSFYKKLTETPPKVSKIDQHSIQRVEFWEYSDFQIIPSQEEGKLNIPLTPDFALCDTCKNEISDQGNRRYGYPFTTCVNCGPRWAITNTFPFERDHTSIDEFEMCEICVKEYTNPADRRFHSQTNSCPSCGITIFLTDAGGTSLKIDQTDIFKKMAILLEEGKIIAIKNTGGYLLCCDASNASAVLELRIRKNRPTKPFAILYTSLALLEQHQDLTKMQKKALTSTERPIVIIPRSNFKGNLAFAELAPNLNQLGVMLPYSGILQLLANEVNMPLVATSGNIHGSPIISSRKTAKKELAGIADFFLHHSLKISHPQDDSVVKYSTKFDQSVLFRRSRGYAPNYLNTGSLTDEKIMAMGGHLKSTIAFLPNDYLYISQYLGNLDHYDVYNRFTNTVSNFITLFGQKPDVILTDKHPSYQSTAYGKELSHKFNVKVHKIQHHKAHFASILGEHDLFDSKDPILGVVWDGTGYGEDGHIWGGEFFGYRSKKMERITHFEYFDWLAGDKMAKEPRLSLLSLANDNLHSVIAEKFTKEELTIYGSLKKQNKLKTSSVGRLFDAVASVLDICDKNTYEGEAAILLENLVIDYDLKSCKSYLNPTNKEISPKEIINGVYTDKKNSISKEQIIINFIFTLATSILQMAKTKNFNHIALSGGVFQNTTLVDMLLEIVPKEIKLYFHKELSPNDENISFGQIMYYGHITN